MSPEEYQEMIESFENLADMLDRVKGELTKKGWTEEGAERAAVAAFHKSS